MTDWDQIQRTAERATPAIRELARELAENSQQDAWFEPFDAEDEWLLAALVRAYELGKR